MENNNDLATLPTKDSRNIDAKQEYQMVRRAIKLDDANHEDSSKMTQPEPLLSLFSFVG